MAKQKYSFIPVQSAHIDEYIQAANAKVKGVEVSQDFDKVPDTVIEIEFEELENLFDAAKMYGLFVAMRKQVYTDKLSE